MLELTTILLALHCKLTSPFYSMYNTLYALYHYFGIYMVNLAAILDLHLHDCRKMFK